MELRKRKVNDNDDDDKSVKQQQKHRRRSEAAKKVDCNSETKNNEISSSVVGFSIQDFLVDSEWKDLLKSEFEKDYFREINITLKRGYATKNLVKPPKELVFNAFNLTPLKDIKCVILGQDPYHDEDQAHGLAFSVPENIPPPPSLKNIFKELENDIPGFQRADTNNGCLLKWTKEGVFLLNTCLTVEAHRPGSHAKLGWTEFTDRVISLISELNDGCVFLLWGNAAHKKETLVSTHKNHKVIKTAHPSPLSLNKFMNSKCFSQTNQHLKSIGKTEINWSL